MLLPGQVVPHSGYSADDIGTALLATAQERSRRAIAAELTVPVGTLPEHRGNPPVSGG